MNCTRFLLPLLLALVLFSACSDDNADSALVQDEPTGYSFFVAGHTYGNPINYQFGLHPPFDNAIPWLDRYEGMTAGIFTGDIVPKATADYWAAAIDDMDKFSFPLYVAPGNHDRGEVFEKIFQKYYQWFSIGSDLFIVLSPTDWNIEGDQLAFLQSTLERYAAEYKNIFIFCHELIWWSPDNQFGKIEINARDHYPGSTNYWSEVHPILDSLENNVVIFAGDLGANPQTTPYMYYNQDNISLIGTGMGGGVKDNVVIVDVDKKGNVSYKLIGLNADEPFEMPALEKYKLPE